MRSPLRTRRPERCLTSPKRFSFSCKGGGKNAECCGRPLLISTGGNQRRDNQVPFEAQKDVAQRHTLGARARNNGVRSKKEWTREITEHAEKDRPCTVPGQWMRASFRMNLG